MSILDGLILGFDETNHLNEENDTEVPVNNPIEKKIKKKRTHWCIPNEAQLEGMRKGRLIRDENARIRKVNRELKAQEDLKIYEEKLLKKALSLRKKQIKEDYLLSINPEDDIDEDLIRYMVQEIKKNKSTTTTSGSNTTQQQQQSQQQPQPQQHQFIFR